MSTRVWRDPRVKLSNQKIVFKQLTGLNVGDKTRKFTFQLVLQHNISEQLERFCCLFKGQPLLHDFSSKVSCIFWLKGKIPNTPFFYCMVLNSKFTHQGLSNKRFKSLKVTSVQIKPTFLRVIVNFWAWQVSLLICTSVIFFNYWITEKKKHFQNQRNTYRVLHCSRE